MVAGTIAATLNVDHFIQGIILMNFSTVQLNLIIIVVDVYFSLKEPKKYIARRSNKDNQQISIITSDNNGGPSSNNRHHPAQVQPQQPQQQNMYSDNRGGNTQVKTYTDHGNGHSAIRTGNSSHYSKVNVFYINIVLRTICISV